MANTYTAITKHDENRWIGWIEEVPGVNCKERSREELIDSLKVTRKKPLSLTAKKRFKRSSVPRHREVRDQLARKICKDLGIPFRT